MLPFIVQFFVFLFRAPVGLGLSAICGAVLASAWKDQEIRAAKAMIKEHEKRKRDIKVWVEKMSEKIPRRFELVRKIHAKTMRKVQKENRDLQGQLDCIWSVLCPNNARARKMDPNHWWEEKQMILKILEKEPQRRHSIHMSEKKVESRE